MTTTESGKKAVKRKELTVGQLKAVAADIARRLADRTTPQDQGWREFSELPQSERRKVVDLLAENGREVASPNALTLSRMALSEGVANKHEAVLKSVVLFCSRVLKQEEQQEVLCEVLTDLIDPARLPPSFALPRLDDLDALEVAG